MNLQKTLFAGALLTVVVAALWAQEKAPPDAAPAAEEQLSPLPEGPTGRLQVDQPSSAAVRGKLDDRRQHPADRHIGVESDMQQLIQMVAAGQAPVDLTGLYRTADEESVQIARRFRNMAERDPTSAELERVRQSLVKAVTAAFDVRQRAQEAEVTRLQERLKNLERTISSRNNARQQIIERRVSELINPEQRWGDGTGESGRAPPGTSQRPSALLPETSNQIRTALNRYKDSQQMLSRPDSEPASTAEHSASSQDGSLSRPPSAPGSDSEARTMIEALSAVGKARMALADSEAQVETQTANLKRWQEGNSDRVDPRSASAREKILQRAQTQRQRAENDLNIAIRQERQARLSLETRIKLLQIDLESAKLSLEQAIREEARAKALHERAVITRSEFEEKQTTSRLARLAVQKSETLLSSAQQVLKAADEYQTVPDASPRPGSTSSSPRLDPGGPTQRLDPPPRIERLDPFQPSERLDPASPDERLDPPAPSSGKE